MAEQIIVLITGGNTGVGFETAKNLLLSSAAYHVLIGSRDPAKGAAAAAALSSSSIKGTVTHIRIDVTNDASIDAAALHVETTHGRLDILVNNAGISGSGHTVPRDGLREILAVNVVGALSTTEAFLPLLRKSKSARLVFVSSSLGSIGEAADPKGKYRNARGTEYRASKAALNMIMVQYDARLGGEGIKVFSADPGLNATNLTGDAESLRQRGAVEPHVGGERIATVIKGQRDADVGRVCGEYGVSPW
ncbi:putative carbonyl reductase [Athelia psychrophila]|uniref:Carbonyl reductase n=1 Tax=Athelia psychrophila TaxID=1759441 RepID=A0A167XRR9_9AGAM|nr:putative carbonyl reductase [Fibularhizoctonia sp. CBS 109695]